MIQSSTDACGSCGDYAIAAAESTKVLRVSYRSVLPDCRGKSFTAYSTHGIGGDNVGSTA